MELVLESLSDTEQFASELSHIIGAGDRVLLLGEMGAGKTTFVRHFLGSRGFQGNVTSPTFTLIQEYILEPNIYHMDLYRLENELEIEQLDIQRYFQNDSCIIFVEWADKLGALVPDNYLEIAFSYFEITKRKVVITPKGTYKDRFKSITFLKDT